jgi:Ca-activated chloride channel homolog
MTRIYRGLACVMLFGFLPIGCYQRAERAPDTAQSVAPAAAYSSSMAREESERAPEAPAEGAAVPEPASVAHDEAKAEPSKPAPPSVGAGARLRAAKRKAGGTVSLGAPLQAPPPATAAPEFDTEAYAPVVEHGFVSATDAPLSTFSIDVDTASYSNVRRFLRQGQLPPSGAVRIEELINYFPFAYAEPAGDAPFSVTTEVSKAPWNERHRLLHVGIQGKRIDDSKLPPRNLVFLLDVSGSMQDENKLPLLQRSLASLTETLGPDDRIAIAVYAGASGLVLPPTSGADHARILEALDRLEAGGSTNGAEGIELAYRVASDMARSGGINRVILATDGDFNVGVTSQSELLSLIEEKRKSGVFLSVLGFGMGNYKDSTLELLADKGNGNYAYIDSLSEARKVLVKEGGATLLTIAKDVKLQVEFNPAKVAAYRLIGYENRRLEDRDFNDDRKDAGELGAGHSVTALYEIVPPGVPIDLTRVDALKYQSASAPNGAHGGELCSIKLRYKAPSAEQSRLLERAVLDTGRRLDQTTSDFRFSAAVAVFGMVLGESPSRGSSSFALARELAAGSSMPDPEGYRREFASLVDTAAQLKR